MRCLGILFFVVLASALANKLNPRSPLAVKKKCILRHFNNNNRTIIGKKIDSNINTRKDKSIGCFMRREANSGKEKPFNTSLQRGISVTTASRITLPSFIGLFLLSKIYENRSRFPTKEEIQNFTFELATKLKGKGDIGIIYFILGLGCCETFGLSTFPVEVSGGFVYGIKQGFIINLLGKLLGATMAFMIGKYFLSARIKSKFLSNHMPMSTIKKKEKTENNTTQKSTEIINLIQSCITEEPFATALVLRYSMFPQLIKNLILSVMDLSWKLFLLVTSLQVMPFSMLFTCLGNDSAQRIINPDLPINYILSACFIVSSIYGVIGGTTVTAIWYHNKTKKKLNSA